MLELYKGVLDYDTIVYKLPFKRVLELKDARVRRLTKEKEDMENEMKNKQSEDLRRKILLPGMD